MKEKKDNDISTLIHHNTVLAMIIIISQLFFAIDTVLFLLMLFTN